MMGEPGFFSCGRGSPLEPYPVAHRTMPTSHRSIHWIESLAEQELKVSAGERVGIDLGATRDEVLSVETATFVRELHSHMDYLVTVFNARVSDSALQIRVLKGGDGLEGFSLSRNHIRLTITRLRAGVVQILCDKRLPPEMNGGRPTVMSSGALEARFATFDDVEWEFLGSPVNAEQVARHYLTEFIQTSRHPALLQDRGQEQAEVFGKASPNRSPQEIVQSDETGLGEV